MSFPANPGEGEAVDPACWQSGGEGACPCGWAEAMGVDCGQALQGLLSAHGPVPLESGPSTGTVLRGEELVFIYSLS